jgi:phosphoglycerate dehydrogenase-like enzyme
LYIATHGEVLGAAALAAAIRGKKIAGAAIDVFDPEPPPAEYALTALLEAFGDLEHVGAWTRGCR